MDDNMKLPSLPSNYVTLLQLQERWNKEQQRKQDKEEQEKREREEQERKLKDEQEKQKQFQRTDTDSKPTGNTLRFRRKYRYGNEKTRRNVEVAKPEESEVAKPEESEVEAVVALEKSTRAGEVELKMKKKRKKSKKWNKNKKEEARADESETHAPEGSGEKENVPARSNGVRKGVRSEFRPKSKNVVVVDRTVEIERKLGNLSVKDGIINGGSVRRNVINTGRREYRGYWRLPNHQRRENSGEMVWVRKGEVCDGNGGGIPSSSSCSKACE